MQTSTLWKKCIERLEEDIVPEEFNVWIRCLQFEKHNDQLYLLAPNQSVFDHVRLHFIELIMQHLRELSPAGLPNLQLKVGNKSIPETDTPTAPLTPSEKNKADTSDPLVEREGENSLFQYSKANKPNPLFSFDNFVEGKSNQLARAASLQVGHHPGIAYNPLFIYGGVGLGKTHLMHAVGNSILDKNPKARVIYVHSERFVADMITALRRNAMNEFKRYYRSADALLIDDIQFFAGKDRSQEEFFHTFNNLLDSQHQVILTCDRYPKELNGLEERLKSRFGWGLTVAVEPPDLETRVAIVMSKAEQFEVALPAEVAFFIGKHVQSNVRELEGALRRVSASARFAVKPITIESAREALKDLLAVQAKLVSIDNIQKTVADYYKIKMADLLSAKRNRFLARARQLAMTLAKELTTHSLPEIGEAFGGRDHTTVIHACRKIKELIEVDNGLREDYVSLLRVLSA